MKSNNFARWMYRGQHPNWLARIMNSASPVIHCIAPNYLVTLDVTGRKSGKMISLPLVMAVVDVQRYLVSMLGDNAQWVLNVRAAGGRVVIRSGKREQCQLEELATDQRPPILKAYLQRASRGAASYTREQRCPACGIQKNRRGISGFSGSFQPIGLIDSSFLVRCNSSKLCFWTAVCFLEQFPLLLRE